MNPPTQTKGATVQPVEMPPVDVQPLHIHPSIPEDLAREMLRVADTFSQYPKLYDGDRPNVMPWRFGHECGSVIAYLCLKSLEDPNGRSALPTACANWPRHAGALNAIFIEASKAENCDNPQWAIRRIEKFLETAQ